MSVTYGFSASLYFVIIYINVVIHFTSLHFSFFAVIAHSLHLLFCSYAIAIIFLLSSLSLYQVPKHVLFLYF